MISLFLGLTGANLALLVVTLSMGLFAADAVGEPTRWYGLHVGVAIMSGMFCVLAQVAVYTYFMATTKWLGAATDKAALDPRRFVEPARRRKLFAFGVCMTPVAVVMLAMFAGAGADPTAGQPWWPAQVHLALAVAAVVINMVAAILQYRLIRAQGELIDEAARRACVAADKRADETSVVGHAS